MQKLKMEREAQIVDVQKDTFYINTQAEQTFAFCSVYFIRWKGNSYLRLNLIKYSIIIINL